MAQRREPGVLVLAKELNGAIEKHVEDREYSPTYLISEIGGKLSRVLIAGVLDQLENRGSESDPFYTARVIDPNGDFYYLCLLYTSPSPRDRTRSRMPSSA